MKTLKLLLVIITCNTMLLCNSNFNDNKIKIMLEEYFIEDSSSPLLLGHKFYIDKNNTVLQLEIEPNTNDINNSLLFSFKAMSLLANLSNKQFTHGVLIIHFDFESLPIVAKTDLKCAQRFFVEGEINEKKWRKECLTIKNN